MTNGEPEAKVIPLHGASRRTPQSAAGVGGQTRDEVLRRHPSLLSAQGERPTPEEVATVVRALDESLASATERAQDVELNDNGEPALVRGVARIASFLRRRVTGDYQVDDFGFDQHLNEAVLLPILRPVFDKWFRTEVTGIENLPAHGAALIVANHAGVLPLDGLMTSVAVHDLTAGQRDLRLLAADMAFDMPLIGGLARKAGHTLACNPDAERLLREGELAAVFPEGYKGLGKPYKDRYKLQRFGRGGFVAVALRTGVPIIPCSIVGSEEIYPKIGELKTLARLMGMPYFPITPTFPLLGPLGMVPLPSKWHIEFGEPIDTSGYDAGAADDPMVVFELTDHVRETIQQTLYRLLLGRRNIFLG